MKNFTKTLAALVVTTMLSVVNYSVVNAQQLPDQHFEKWSGTFNGKIQPTSWSISNVEQSVLGITARANMGEQTTGRSGYALKVYDAEVGAANITEVSPGYATCGETWMYFAGLSNLNASTAGTKGGISFTYRPDSIVTWIKREGADVDKQAYQIIFYSWRGTSEGTAYKGKDGSCTSYTVTNEESDIRQKNDANDCTTSKQATQIAEGWLRDTVKQGYSDWTRISIPISYFVANQKPEMCNVIFSAGNYPNKRDSKGLYAGLSLTVDDVELIYNSTIDELQINGTKVKGFSATTTEFTKANEKVSYSPEADDFTLFRSGRLLDADEYTININGAAVDNDTPVIITVKAEDGSSITTYQIKFTSTPSSNYRPESITYQLDGKEYTLPNWNPNAYDYEVSLPYGTTQTPEVVVVTSESTQTAKITQPSGPTGKATVVMTAQSGASQTYTISFSVAQLTDNTLKNILIDGESLLGFSPTKNNYDVELPLGTTAAPNVTWESNYTAGAQTITLTSNTLSGSSGKATITVEVPGNKTIRTYTLNYEVKASSYAYLADLKVGGTTIDGFIPATRSYFYDLPMGTTALPTITYEKGQSGQTITVDDSEIENLSGDYKITVTAEDGTAVTYYITFTLLKSSNVDLTAIYVNGIAIEGFKSDVLEYNVEVDASRTEASVVTADKGEADQTVTISKMSGPEGEATVKVTAADGKTRRTYTITTYQNKSTDNTLKEILVNGEKIAGFSADKTEYTYTYTGTKPTVTYTVNDATATATSRDRNGVITITVTAQDGSKNYYYVTLTEETIELSDYAYLEALYVDGVAVTDFTPTTLNYTFVLSTWAKPSAVTYDAKDGVTVGTPKILWNSNTKVYRATVLVTAEDGTTKNTYTITFEEGQGGTLSSDATLSSLMYGGTSVNNFNASITEYSVVLPVGTTTVPTVTATATHSAAKVTVTQAVSVSGTAQVVVTAEDGKTTQTYKITFSVSQTELSSDATLSDLKVDGTTISDFAASKTDYSITIPFGGSIPTVTATANHSAAKVDIQKGTNSVSVTVTAENGATQVYTVTFIEEGDTRSDDATLSALTIDGETIGGFSAETTSYTYTIPFGGSIPVVAATANHSAATVSITQATSSTMRAQVVVTAENQTKQTYVVTFTMGADPRSTDATLSDLKVDGVTISNFTASQQSYSYEIPFGGSVPEISATANDEAATLKITQATSKTGRAVVVVTAENGSTLTYTVQFSEAGDTRSNDATLSELTINGDLINGFTSTKTNYTYQVPFGAGIPEVAAVANHSAATFVITQATSITGSAVVVVTAENGSQKTYTITFSEASDPRSTDASLQSISVDIEGSWSQTFRPAVVEYTYTLPVGTTAIPQVTCQVNNAAAQATIQQPQSAEGDAVITVQAEHPDYSRIYTIHFVVKQSNNANLSAIYLNGEMIEGFAPQTLNYRYTVEYGGTIPEVTYQLDDAEYAKAEITYAETVPGATQIVVTAQDGTQKTYYVRFVEASDTRNTDATLSIIEIAAQGTWSNAFLPGRTSYIYTLPAGTTEVPEVSYGLSDANATAEYIPATDVKGKAQIVVTAENPDFVTTYTIQFAIAKSSNAQLADIQVDGVALADFSPEENNYSYEVAFGATVVPQITATPADQGASVNIINAAVLSSKTLIYVTAEDGTQNLYQVSFTFAEDTRDGETALADILVGGVSLDGFNPVQYRYEVELPTGITALPNVEAVAVNDLQKVDINYQSETLPTSVVLTVTAQNGDRSQYIINFTVKKSNNVTLNMIYVGGEPLADFTPDNYSYTKNIGDATQVPVITVDKSDAYQTVEISTPRSNDMAEIKVIAADGIENATYTIKFEGNIVINQYNPQLTDLKINGVTVDDFSSNTYEYDVEISKTITLWENLTVSYETNDDTKDVTMQKTTSFVQNGEFLLILTSNDANAVNTYKVRFLPQLDKDCMLESVSFDGTSFTDFDPSVDNYNLKETTLSSLTYKKSSDEQKVIYRELEGSKIVLDVYAEDTTVHCTYTFNFKEETQTLNSDVTLKSITIGTETKEFVDWTDEDFNTYKANPSTYGSDEILWTLDMPVGVDTIPSIKVVPTDPTVQIYVAQTLEIGYAYLQIHAIPQEKNWSEYYNVKLNFHKATENRLDSIYFGTTKMKVRDMEPDEDGNVYIPTDELPLNSDYPTVSYVLGESHQTVSELGNGSRQVVLSVRAQDEKQAAVNYIVNFTRGKYSNTSLSKIFIGGDEQVVKDEISYKIPIGGKLPEVTWERADTTQHVLQINNGSSGVKLLVVAENGDTKLYTITFDYERSGNSALKDLWVYKKGQYESVFAELSKSNTCEVTVSGDDAKQMPAVMPIPEDSLAKVTIDYAWFDEQTKIHVEAPDKDAQHFTDYYITFKQEKSSDATLKSVELVDNTSFSFEYDSFNYFDIPIASDAVSHPEIKWEKNDPEQKITFVDAGLGDTTKIIVTSPNENNTKTYQFTFTKVDNQDKPNKLQAVYVEGYQVKVGDVVNGECSGSVVLPYGIDKCNITYITNYEGQTVLVANNGVGNTSVLKVLSNIEGVDDVTYYIDIQTIVRGITLNGDKYDAFDPTVFDYVYVEEGVNAPDAEIKFDYYEDYKSLYPEIDIVTTSNAKYATLVLSTYGEELYKYSFSVYYKNDDEKLYLGFDDISYTKYDNRGEINDTQLNTSGLISGQIDADTCYSVKPTGWQAPGDDWKYKEGGSGLIGSQIKPYYTGGEVNMIDEGDNKYVQLNTIYCCPSACSMPGMISLSHQTYNMGTYTISGGISGNIPNSTCTFGDPIVYRNTPDSVSFIHKGQRNHNATNPVKWSFYFEQNKNALIDSVNNMVFRSDWETTLLPLQHDENFVPENLDIRISSSDVTPNNMKNSTATNTNVAKTYQSTLYVDNMQFHYNSTIVSGRVLNTDGSVTVNNETKTITIELDDASFSGIPQLVFKGQVSGGKYDILWDENKVRSYGEDMSYTEYKMIVKGGVTRYLKDILVNNKSVWSGSETINYPLPYGTTELPNVEAKLRNHNQYMTTDLVNTDKGKYQVLIKVWNSYADYETYPSNPARTYTINMTWSNTSDNTLTDIQEGGATLTDFDANKTEYTTQIDYKESFKAITYTKAQAGQQVTMTVDSISDVKRVIKLMVEAENSTVTSQTYTITQTKTKPADSKGELSEIKVGGKNLTIGSNMSSDKSDYATDPNALTSFTRSFPTDTVRQIIQGNTINWTVKGANNDTKDYQLTFSNVSDVTDNELGSLTVNNEVMELTTYNTYKSNDSLRIVANLKYEGQILTPAYNKADSTFSITVKPISGEEQTYTIKILADLSDEALLSSLSAQGYQLQPAFDANTTSYTLVLNEDNIPQLMPRRTPKSLPLKGGLLGLMPAIEAHAQGLVKDMKIYYQNSKITIEVIPENGDEDKSNLYEINVVNTAKAPALDNIAIFGETVPDFASDKYEYTMELPNHGNDGISPLVGYKSGNPYQTVTTNADEFGYPEEGTLQVKAEVGSESVTYNIKFSYRSADISSNAKLAQLYVNDKLLDNINDELNPSFEYETEQTLIDVNPVRAENTQNVEVIKSDNKIEVKVTAQDGTTKNSYTINIKKKYVATSTNTDINVYLNGVLKNDLVKNDENANNIEVDSKLNIGWVITEVGQVVEKAVEENRIVLAVTAPNGVDEAKYYINVTYKKSDFVFNLMSIRLDGKDLTAYNTELPFKVIPAKFVSDIYEYIVEMPTDNIETLPVIDAVKASNDQVLNWDTWFRSDKDMTETLAKVTVTTSIKDREDLPKRQYVLNFVKKLNQDASPEQILIDNIPMVDFTDGDVDYIPTQHGYIVTLGMNTAEVPEVSLLLREHQSIVSQTVIPNLTNNPYEYKSEFVVQAQAGNYDTYTVTLIIPQDDRNALTDLRVDGLTIKRETEAFTANADFNPSELTYNITYPVLKDTTLKPVITYTAESENAKVSLKEPLNYADFARILVEPYYGMEREYKVYFTLTQDTVTTLDDLQLDGATITGFDPATQKYSVELERGTLTLPVIEGFATSPRATVSVSAGNIVDRKAEAVLTVTAESGKQRVYSIDFTVAVDNTITLAGILIDNVELEEFLSNINMYSLERDTTADQIVEGVKADPTQKLSYETKELNDGGKSVTITITAESGAKGYYTLNFTMPVVIPEPIELNDNAYLLTIDLNNAQIAGFDKEVFVYDVELARGSQHYPHVDAVAESDKAAVNIDSVEIADHKGEVNIIVTSEAKTTLLYTLHFIVAVDSTTTLNDLTVGGKSVADFSPTTFNYTYLYDKESDLTIDYDKADDAQTIEVTQTTAGDATIVFVKVTAEAGPNVTNTYIITLSPKPEPVVEPDESEKDATLKMITIDGNEIADFQGTKTMYNITLDAASWVVVGEPAQDGAIVNTQVTILSEINAKQVALTVTALDGVTTLTYTVIIIPTSDIQPDPTQCSDNLEDILVGGQTWSSMGGSPALFNASVSNYSLQLPSGTTTFPTVIGSSSSDCLEIAEIENTIDQRTHDCVIYVRGKDNNGLIFDKATYTVRLILPVETPDPVVNPADCPAELEGIRVNGKDWNTLDTISDSFSAAISEYTIRMPQGTKNFPVITGYVSSEESCLTVINGTPKVIDDYNRVEYIIVHGTDNNGLSFDKATYTINVVMPQEADQPEPVIPCPDLLEDILVDGKSWSVQDSVSKPFSANRYEYDLYLPAETKIFPTVEGYLSNPDDACLQLPDEAEVTDINDAYRVATLNIESYDNNLDITILTYTINMHILPFTDATINKIYVEDEEILVTDTNQYTVILPVGTREYPAIDMIDCEMNEPTSSFTVSRLDDEQFDYNALFLITCTAQSGNTKSYYLNFIVAKDSNADLQDLVLVDGNGNEITENVSLSPAFESDVTEYSIELPRGTEAAPDFSHSVLASLYAAMTIDKAMTTATNGVVTITVTAENGDTKKYVFSLTVEVSNTALLSDIILDIDLDGNMTQQSVDNFDSRNFNYTQDLQYGISHNYQVTIIPVPADNATYTIERGASLTDPTYIVVTAEDGLTQNTYSIVFTLQRSTNAVPQMLYLDGVSMTSKQLYLDGMFVTLDTIFEADNYEYLVTLPAGTTSLPEVTALAADTQQVITISTTGMTTQVTVVAGAGKPTNEYLVEFEVAKYDINTLEDLSIYGKTIDGFRRDSNYYVIQYPAETPIENIFTTSDVAWVLTDPETSSAAVSQSDAMTWLVTVTAENGAQNVYVIVAEIKLPDNALLDNLLIDGITINDFDPLVFDYIYYLYVGQPMPEIEGIPQDSDAVVTVNLGTVGEYTYIKVIAADNNTEVVYRVLVTLSPIDLSSDATDEDVCIRHIGNGTYKASAAKRNVQLAVYDVSGQLLHFVSVPVIEANEDLCESETGVEIQLENNTPYLYLFVNNLKRKVTRGKIMYIK